jgi:hypothetical protein
LPAVKDAMLFVGSKLLASFNRYKANPVDPYDLYLLLIHFQSCYPIGSGGNILVLELDIVLLGRLVFMLGLGFVLVLLVGFGLGFELELGLPFVFWFRLEFGLWLRFWLGLG